MQGRAVDEDALRFYQRVEWRWRRGRKVYALVERDPGEARWVDFVAFYGRWQLRPLEIVVGDVRPGWGQGRGLRARDEGQGDAVSGL